MTLNLLSGVLPTGPNTYTLFDMSAEKIAEIEKKMHSKIYSELGFLSSDQTFENVCVKDLNTLYSLGISCGKISDTLTGIIKKASEIAKAHAKFYVPNSVIIENRFEVFGVEKKPITEYQPCPFHKLDELCWQWGKEYKVTNLKTRESVSFSGLAISMIKKHAFFLGGYPARIDPIKICRVLEIKPGQYVRATEKIWSLCGSFDDGEISIKKAQNTAKELAEIVEKLGKKSIAYFGLPYRNFNDYKDKGLTRLQKLQILEMHSSRSQEKIENQIKYQKKFWEKYGEEWNPHQPVFIENGKRFCHVFCNQGELYWDDDSGLPFELEGRVMDKPYGTNVTVYEPVDITYAVID